MKNKLGDKAFVDTFEVCSDDGHIYFFVELDGISFDSREYLNFSDWLQSIVNRTYDCAMGKCN